jgi:phosphoribosylglycinamide formyltransferase-1
MKIGIFAYNFKHWKTQAGIQNLCMAGYKPEVIFAADPVELKFYQSKIRISPKDLFLWHPKELSDFYSIDYRVVKHNSEETAAIVKEKSLDLGIILGARILKPIAFKEFSIGVMNMHPGILPQNRGLDNVKWAIIDKKPQGVTTHLINDKIDRGLQILQEKITIYEDDTLLDIHLRLQNLEQKLMIDSVSFLTQPSAKLKTLEKGTYYKNVPMDMEKEIIQTFDDYKKEFKNGKG